MFLLEMSPTPISPLHASTMLRQMYVLIHDTNELNIVIELKT